MAEKQSESPVTPAAPTAGGLTAPGGATATKAIAVVAALALLVCGIGLQLVGHTQASVQFTGLRKSLDLFPREFLGYTWRDKYLDPDIEKMAGAAYYINVQGFRPRDASGASVYVSYYGEAATLVEHEPQVCMVAGGWDLPWGVQRESIQIPAGPGKPAWELPVNVYVFRKDMDNLLMLNYYCVNGRYFNSRDDVRVAGLVGRGYYTQTRVSIGLSDFDRARLTEKNVSESETYKRAVEILQYMVPQLEEYLPAVDASGQVGK